jgi:multiple sugar transport system substrate-binding protein
VNKALLVLSCTGLLAACSGSAADGGATRLQLVLSGDPVEVAGYTRMVEAFEAENPGVDVDLVPVARGDDLLARLTTAFAAGAPPEVFLVNTRSFGRFAAESALAPVGPYLERSEALSAEDFYPTAFDAFTVDGELQCMPQNLSSLVVYYNRDLFEQRGVPLPGPDWTWDEFLAAARALTGGGTYGVGTEASLIRVAPFVWQAGGEVVDDPADPSRLTLTEAPGRAGLDFFLDLQLRHGVVPPEREERSEDAESRFLRGGLGMLLDSRRATPSLRTIEGFAWDVAPVPVAPGGTAVSVLHSDAYCLSAPGDGDADPDAGWRLVEFAMGEQGQALLAETGRTVPSRTDVSTSPAFLDPEQPPASAQVWLDAAPTLRALPTVPAWAQVEKEGDELLEAVFYGRVDREEGLRRLEERAASLLAGQG